MNIQTTPIAIPMIRPIARPLLSDKSVSGIVIIVSLDERVSLRITVSSLISESVGSNSISIWSLGGFMSDEIFVNFAASVIGSVVEFPPNKVECVKSV